MKQANPVQLAIGQTVSQFSGILIEDIAVGIDGCGVPVFGVTVKAMALMYARLVAPPAEFDESTRKACRRIVEAMTMYPELIGGTSDRLDTEMMRATGGSLISKVGAEGVYTAGVLPCAEWPNGLGLALKIEDGDDHRARPTVVIESLNQLGVLNDEALEAVSRYAFFPIRNRNGEVVGEVRASFKLNRRNMVETNVSSKPQRKRSAPDQPPLLRDARGRIDVDSVPDVIQWFLDYDSRVAIIKHPRVEEVFQWKQEQSRQTSEEIFVFNSAEDRLAIGIIQALAENATKTHCMAGLVSC